MQRDSVDLARRTGDATYEARACLNIQALNAKHGNRYLHSSFDTAGLSYESDRYSKNTTTDLRKQQIFSRRIRDLGVRSDRLWLGLLASSLMVVDEWMNLLFP